MKQWITRSMLLSMLIGWSSANAATTEVNVLLVGNSLAYVNNLPALFNGLAAHWQGQLSRGLRKLADMTGAQALDTGPLVRSYAKAHPQASMYSDAMLHPTLDASLLMAACLYRMIAANPPQASLFAIDVPLLPGLARVDADKLLSGQAQLAGDGAITSIDAGRLQPLIEAAAEEKE